jgi:regulator of protease activity HflC (stomatin/prohibitin superfamily)
MAKPERRLGTLEKSLKGLRSRARQARGEARKQLARLERQARAALAEALRKAEPKVRKAMAEAQVLGRGVRAGVKAGMEAYRASRRNR